VPKGSAVHDPKTKENKERESENMNSKGEMWKQCESQGGRHIKTGIYVILGGSKQQSDVIK
jgi:hypothetical protein